MGFRGLPRLASGEVDPGAYIAWLEERIRALEMGRNDVPTPMVIVRSASGATPASATLTTWTFSSVDVGDAGLWDAANNRIVFDRTGIWEVGVFFNWTANATGYRLAWINRGGNAAGTDDTNIVVEDARPAVNGSNTTLSIAKPWGFASGDYVHARIYQTSGGGLGQDTTNDRYATLWATFVRPL